jgi:hypothetical protein
MEHPIDRNPAFAQFLDCLFLGVRPLLGLGRFFVSLALLKDHDLAPAIWQTFLGIPMQSRTSSRPAHPLPGRLNRSVPQQEEPHQPPFLQPGFESARAHDALLYGPVSPEG